jgi:hypothetical protein
MNIPSTRDHKHENATAGVFIHKMHTFLVIKVLQEICNIQGVSRLVDITAGGDFLGLCDQKSSYKHVSNFGRIRSYGHFLIPVHALV